MMTDSELAALPEVSPIGSKVLWQESDAPHILWDGLGRAWRVGTALGKTWKERRRDYDDHEPPPYSAWDRAVWDSGYRVGVLEATTILRELSDVEAAGTVGGDVEAMSSRYNRAWTAARAFLAKAEGKP